MSDLVFSVILPTHNRPDSLLRCLHALAALITPRDTYEVVVINDGANWPDQSALRQATDGLQLTVLSQDHKGPAVARNTGAARAAGRYLAFIDDDCVPRGDWLAMLSRRFEQQPEALIGGSTINALAEYIYSDATQLMVDFMIQYFTGDGPGRTRFFATSNLAAPRDRFCALGGFDVRFAYAAGEDRDFCRRWHLSGASSVYEPEAVVYHRHPLTLSEYLAQHFRYGRGALQFHRAEAQGGARSARAPARFYRDLIFYPLTQRQVLAGAARSAALLASQAATAAGYFWEWARLARDEPSD